jgi:16S rRNA (guanine527-N7)-methyltransferase
MTISLSAEQRQALATYLDELYRWNQRLNLTRVAAADAWARHVDESLMLLAAADPASGDRVVDVGSGTGAPGIAVAVARPDLEVALLEADARKAAFLNHVAGALGLAQVRVLHGRAETAGRDPALREAFDLALARAVAQPAVLLELALPLVRPGGRLCALVSDTADAAQRCDPAARMLGGAAPQATDRVLMVLKRTATPARYPRKPGVPARRPL